MLRNILSENAEIELEKNREEFSIHFNIIVLKKWFFSLAYTVLLFSYYSYVHF